MVLFVCVGKTLFRGIILGDLRIINACPRTEESPPPPPVPFGLYFLRT